jgi:hypothetical protein
MKWKQRAGWGAAGFFAVVAGGCGCPDPPVEPSGTVQIVGQVRNVDNGRPAPGVRVTLWGHEGPTSAETDSEGNYRITVPVGATLLLHTDDFDSTNDVWFPLINAELPSLTATEPLTDWTIHACPRSTCPEVGSVGVWDDYLENDDDANGDLFEPTRSADSGGILSVLLFEVWHREAEGDTVFNGMADIEVSVSDPDLPAGYMRSVFTKQGTPHCELADPVALFPSTRTVTPGETGWALSFAPSGFDREHVAVSFRDTLSSREHDITPYIVPMAPGTITLTLGGSLNGVPNQRFADFKHAFGL